MSVRRGRLRFPRRWMARVFLLPVVGWRLRRLRRVLRTATLPARTRVVTPNLAPAARPRAGTPGHRVG